MSETDAFAALMQLATAGEQQQQQQQQQQQEQEQREEPHTQGEGKAEAEGKQQGWEGEVAVAADEEEEEGEIAEVLDGPSVNQAQERVYLEECPTNKHAPPGNQKRVRTHRPRRSVALPLSLSSPFLPAGASP